MQAEILKSAKFLIVDDEFANVRVLEQMLERWGCHDALTHERSYKKAWPIAEAVAEIERQSGRQFDPRVVETFLQVQRSQPSTTTIPSSSHDE